MILDHISFWLEQLFDFVEAKVSLFELSDVEWWYI